MRFTETTLAGVYVVEVEPIADERGFFGRLFCEREFAERGLEHAFAQANVGVSLRRRTLRGMHLQRDPHAEAKLVRCTRGKLFDAVVDLREGSPSRLAWFGLELEADGITMLYVPPGCAHGYLTLVDDTELVYSTSEAYAPDAATGYHHADPAFGIEWPEPVEVISAQDDAWPLLGQADRGSRLGTGRD